MAHDADTVDPLPTSEALRWPTLQALKELGGAATIAAIEQAVVRLSRLTDVQQRIPHGPGPRTEIGYRLAWARTDLKNRGAIENASRGRWSLTPLGRTMTEADVLGPYARVGDTPGRSLSRRRHQASPAERGTERRYWLDLFTGMTWDEFIASGAEVTGFREPHWSRLQKVQPGDLLLCYLTGTSRWIGLLEVASAPFRDDAPIWRVSTFPCRVKVKPLVTLTPETAVPIAELKDRLGMFQNLKNPALWTGALRGSLRSVKSADGELIAAALTEAQQHPTIRPVDVAKLYRRHKVLLSELGPVTVPPADEPPQALVQAPQSPSPGAEVTAHKEIQWLLLKLGNDMGLDVWVARNDRGLEVNGQRAVDLPRLRKALPHQFDEATNRTIELIDVLWLHGNAIVAAFEIESTTSIYSGLLRMSDLVAMQPNLNIPLYLVAPDERRDKVLDEVNRPTFSRLSPPLNRMCRFIPFSGLRQRIPQYAPVMRHLKPDFIYDLSEACVINGPSLPDRD